MGKPGRPPNLEPRVKWNVSLPESLAATAELLMLDPRTQKPKSGLRSALVEQAVRDYVERAQRHAHRSDDTPPFQGEGNEGSPPSSLTRLIR